MEASAAFCEHRGNLGGVTPATEGRQPETHDRPADPRKRDSATGDELPSDPLSDEGGDPPRWEHLLDDEHRLDP